MSELKIDKNIPMPTNRSEANTWRDTAKQMEVGDSFFVPVNSDTASSHKRQYITAILRNAVLNSKYMSRTVDGGIRIWRYE